MDYSMNRLLVTLRVILAGYQCFPFTTSSAIKILPFAVSIKLKPNHNLMSSRCSVPYYNKYPAGCAKCWTRGFVYKEYSCKA